MRELDPQRGDFVTLAGAVADAVIEKSGDGGTTAPQAIPLIRAAEIAQLEANRTITMVEPWPVEMATPVYVHTRFKDGLDNNPYYHG